MQSAVIIGTSLCAALALALFMVRIAPRLGLIDHPGGRKEHASSTPLVGGIAIALSCAVGLALVPLSYAWPLALAMSIIIAVGIADDIREVAPLPKFITQATACLVMVYAAEIQLNSVGALLGWRPIGMWVFAAPMSVFAVIGVINAINMVDGIDGNTGGIAMVAFAAFAFVARESGMWDQYRILLSLTGATAGFLMLNARWPWNKKARTFLGDAGSMLIGFLLGWFAIDLTAGNGSPTQGARSFPPICA